MTALTGGDDSLASKCMAFCQALASQGQVFNFSLSIGPDFTFSLDTRSKAVTSQGIKKKASPSTLRRNARRREEFMAKKQQSSPSRISSGENAVAKAPKCDQCEYSAASEKGLKQHIRMKHKESGTEILRGRRESQGSLDCSIPVLSSTREDNCRVDSCGAPTVGCTCSNLQCCGCNHVDNCECYKSNKITNFCNCEDVSDVPCNQMPKTK